MLYIVSLLYAEYILRNAGVDKIFQGKQKCIQFKIQIISPDRVMDREAWHAAIHGVEKSRTRLSN